MLTRQRVTCSTAPRLRDSAAGLGHPGRTPEPAAEHPLLARQLSQPLLEEAPLCVRVNEIERPAVGRARVLGTVESS
jgi:hypothetical protein